MRSAGAGGQLERAVALGVSLAAHKKWLGIRRPDEKIAANRISNFAWLLYSLAGN